MKRFLGVASFCFSRSCIGGVLLSIVFVLYRAKPQRQIYKGKVLVGFSTGLYRKIIIGELGIMNIGIFMTFIVVFGSIFVIAIIFTLANNNVTLKETIKNELNSKKIRFADKPVRIVKVNESTVEIIDDNGFTREVHICDLEIKESGTSQAKIKK